jgi:hypothetical protein
MKSRFLEGNAGFRATVKGNMSVVRGDSPFIFYATVNGASHALLNMTSESLAEGCEIDSEN